MRFYIANCTRQDQTIFYRLDFNAEGVRLDRIIPPRSISIKAGQQVSIDLKHLSQAQSIMDQLAKVGGRGIDEKNRLPQVIVPYMLSVEKAVPRGLIDQVFQHNKGIQDQKGKLLRKRAAIVASDAVQRAVDANVRQFEAEIEQQDPADGEDGPEGKPVAEGFRVSADDPSNPRAQGAWRQG
jgi:hypothetical protein